MSFKEICNSTLENSTILSLVVVENPSVYIFYVKILFLIIIAAITIFFGLLPLCFNNCRKDARFLNYANVFSGGIFMGIAFFHLFPESSENFEKYFSSPEGVNSSLNGVPISYLMAFISYSLILYLEKVAFNSHSLIAHTHKESISEDIDNNLNEPLLNKEHENSDKIYHNCIPNINLKSNEINEEEELDQDEQIIRNVVSTKGQFSSLLQSRNLSKYNF